MSFIHNLTIGHFDLDEAKKSMSVQATRKLGLPDVAKLRAAYLACFGAEIDLSMMPTEAGFVVVPIGPHWTWDQAYRLGCLSFHAFGLSSAELGRELWFPAPEATSATIGALWELSKAVSPQMDEIERKANVDRMYHWQQEAEERHQEVRSQVAEYVARKGPRLAERQEA